MTNLSVQPLFPPASATRLVRGLYLDENIHQLGSPEQPYIYANYVSSIDGRIAIHEPDNGWQVPKHLTTSIDWILFQELQAQADCLITHSGYLRSLERKELGNILQINGSEENRYLHAWRSTNKLTRQPQVVVVSRSLNFTLPASINVRTQPVCVITGAESDTSKQKALEAQGARVFVVNESGLISACEIEGVLRNIGVHNAYLQTGPDLLHSTLQQELLSRIYLTLDLSLVGGDSMLTMVRGELLAKHTQLKLRSIYYYQQLHQSHNTSNSSIKNPPEDQLYTCFDVVKK